MTVLHATPVSTAQFTWIPADRVLVAEASDLPPFARVYDDACDVGLTLISHRTGREIVVVVNGEHRDAEGELQWWDLVPADFHDRGFTVRVFND